MKNVCALLLLEIIYAAYPLPVAAQESRSAAEVENGDDAQQAEVPRGWLLLPGLSFSDDRGVTAALALFYYFAADDNSRPSEVRVGTAVSSQGDYNIDLRPLLRLHKDALAVIGVVDASQQSWQFWGIGNDAPRDAEATYQRRRVVGQVAVLYRVLADLRVGPMLDLQNVSNLEIETAGAFSEPQMVRGTEGGWVVGPAVRAQWDSRNRVFAPHAGWLIESQARHYDRLFGSDYTFSAFSLDVRTYRELAREHVLALQAFGDFRTGQPPFDQMSVAGGFNLLRGMPRGRLRDLHYVAGQAEYRSPIFLWRFGVAAFLGAGRVAPRIPDFIARGWIYSAGGGLRFAVKERDGVHVRLDVARTNDSSGIYLDILEAF